MDSLAKRLMKVWDVAAGAAIEAVRLLLAGDVDQLRGGHCKEKYKRCKRQ